MPLLSRRAFSLLLGSLAALAVVTQADTSEARRKPKVVWTDVELPESDRRQLRENELRKVLKREARRVQWGNPPDGTVEASIKVTQFTVERRPDVVRVTCSAVGRLGKGPIVKTHFSFGGHPNRAAALESHMLLLVARGVVTRLSSISRERYKTHDSE